MEFGQGGVGESGVAWCGHIRIGARPAVARLLSSKGGVLGGEGAKCGHGGAGSGRGSGGAVSHLTPQLEEAIFRGASGCQMTLRFCWFWDGVRLYQVSFQPYASRAQCVKDGGVEAFLGAGRLGAGGGGCLLLGMNTRRRRAPRGVIKGAGIRFGAAFATEAADHNPP